MIPWLKLLLLALLFTPAPDSWLRVTTTEQISFLFPNRPQKLTKVVNGIPSVIYQTKDNACVTGVVCTDMSVKKVKLTNELAQAIYNELKAGTLAAEGTTLREENTVPYDNMLIKEIVYTVNKDKYEMTYFKRFIFRENFIYQLSIGGRSRHLDALWQEREMFFNSVSFPEAQTEKNQNQKQES